MNPYVWSDLALFGIVVVVILSAPAYWLFRRFFPAGESKAILRQQITRLENEVDAARRENIVLNSRLLEAAESNHAYEEMQGELAGLQAKLFEVEGRYADAETEIEFWRCKDQVSAAADIYYTLGLDYKEEIARFGSVIAWVEHLKSVYDQVKPVAGMIQHDDEN